MVSKVVMTRKAQAQLRDYVRYIRFHLKNSQAASSVMADARKTKAALLNVADSLKYCDYEELKDLGYKTIHFHTHNYFFVFEVRGSTAFIVAVYHDLQDYENLFKSEVL